MNFQILLVEMGLIFNSVFNQFSCLPRAYYANIYAMEIVMAWSTFQKENEKKQIWQILGG